MMKLLLTFALLIATAYCAPAYFLPYGSANGDSTLHRNDDESTDRVSLIGGMNFFGQIRQTVFVNNNGLITLDSSTYEYTPARMNTVGQPMIAIYWGDVDTRPGNGGSVYYRSTVDSALCETVSQFVRDTNDGSTFVGTKLFVVTWDSVGYYNQKVNKLNTFQLILVANQDQTFAIFNYGNIQWTTGDASGGSNGLGGVPAVVGFAKGDGAAAELPISMTGNVIDVEQGTNAYIDGVPQIGQYIFTISSEVVINTCCATSSPPVLSGTPSQLNFDVATIDDVPAFDGTVTATSECTTPASSTVTPTIFAVFGCPVERTWRMTDDCGKSSSVTQFFTYPEVFSEELSMSVPADIALPDAGLSCTSNPIPSTAATGMATTNRGANAQVQYSDSTFTLVNGVCQLNRFWIATDICRKQVVGQQVISIAPPSLSTGSLTTGMLLPPAISVAEYCAMQAVDEGDQKYFCSADGTEYYQCLTGAFNSQSAIMGCPAPLKCNCAVGVSCDPVCDWPPASP